MPPPVRVYSLSPSPPLPSAPPPAKQQPSSPHRQNGSSAPHRSASPTRSHIWSDSMALNAGSAVQSDDARAHHAGIHHSIRSANGRIDAAMPGAFPSIGQKGDFAKRFSPHSPVPPAVPMIGGSGARVPTQYLNSKGEYPPLASNVQSSGGSGSDQSGARRAQVHISSLSDQPLQIWAPQSGNAQAKAEGSRSSIDSPSPFVPKAESARINAHSALSAKPESEAIIDLTKEEPSDFTILDARGPGLAGSNPATVADSERLVCIGLINAIVMSIFGLPAALVSPPIGRLEQFNEHARWNRSDWGLGYDFYLEPGYRPVEMIASIDGTGSAIINVHEVVAPYDVRISMQHLRQEGQARPQMMPKAFGQLAQKYVRALCKPLVEKRVRFYSRCRIVPPSSAQNYMHNIELLAFCRRKDVHRLWHELLRENVYLEGPKHYISHHYVDNAPLEMPITSVPSSHASTQMPLPSYPMQSRGTLIQPKESTEEEKRRQVDAVYASLPDGESLSEVEANPELIKTPLLPHQKQALAFLLDREKKRTFENDGKDGGIVSLWKSKWRLGKIYTYTNVVTLTEQMKRPHICVGAILADDMGLGKTLTTISLIANTFDESREWSKQKLLSDFDEAELGKREESENDNNDNDDDVHISDFKINMSGIAPKRARTGNVTRASPSKKKGKREARKEEAMQKRLSEIKKRSRATLIVLPLTLVTAWEGQVQEHWHNDNSPKIYVHHGQQRCTDPARIARNNIVMTTYSTLASEFRLAESDNEDSDSELSDDDNDAANAYGRNAARAKKKEKALKRKRRMEKRKRKGDVGAGPLQQIEWYRIVLDEAHTIKESLTLQARAVSNLIGRSRICLTGTPVQNKIDDLYSLMRFLRLEPFDDRSTWNRFCGSQEKFTLANSRRSNIDGKNNEPLDSASLARVQTIMKFMTLRRTKDTRTADGKKILELPPKFARTLKLDFEPREKATYNEMRQRYQDDFNKMRENNTLKYNYATILHEISNLRMSCDHMELVEVSKDSKRAKELGPYDSVDSARAIIEDGISRDRTVRYFDLLCDSDQAKCNICLSDLSNFAEMTSERESPVNEAALNSGIDAIEAMKKPVLTQCMHLFCSDCLSQRIGQDTFNTSDEDTRFHCPSCGETVSPLTEMRILQPGDLEQNHKRSFVLAEEKFGIDRGIPIDKRSDYSTKIRALVEDLEAFSRSNASSLLYDPSKASLDQVVADATEREAGCDQVYVAEAAETTLPIKSVIFSQWTTMLDRIARAVHRAGIRAAYLDGRMQRVERAVNLDRFKGDPSVEVLLVSLRAGGVGLNLVTACRAYLMEPYWNPATENQGLDRVHRMGQLRPVVTTKYIMARSIEENMLELQRRKMQLAESVGAKRGALLRREEELSILFGDTFASDQNGRNAGNDNDEAGSRTASEGEDR